MALRVNITREFRLAFIEKVLKVPDVYSPNTLTRLNDSISYYVKYLPDNPLLGMVEPGLEGREFEYRRVVVKPYFKLIYYIERETLHFRDIWDSRQDPDYLVGRL